eukprot:GHVP01053628.1.p1 GENE.GHVP01053628.1~~GHVP01053628.1.p1  ORF type:complete len:334 (+),score=29.66 GHVP01053628.1:174-1175(+)
MFQTRSHHGPSRSSTIRAVITNSASVHGVMLRSMVVCYLAFIFIQSLFSLPLKEFIKDYSRWVPWSLQFFYFLYSFYLSLMEQNNANNRTKRKPSFLAKVAKNYLGEFCGLIQIICTFRFWLYVYPTDVYQQRSWYSDIRFFGMTDIILAVDYYTKVGALQQSGTYIYTILVYMIFLFPTSLLVPFFDGNTESPINTKMVPFVVFLAFVDTQVVSHKLNFAIENSAYFVETAKATLGVSYLMTQDLTDDETQISSEPPKVIVTKMFKRTVTKLGNELFCPKEEEAEEQSPTSQKLHVFAKVDGTWYKSVGQICGKDFYFRFRTLQLIGLPKLT